MRNKDLIWVLLLLYRKGDYHRYLAEFATGGERKDAAENSLVAYKEASDSANKALQPTHPIRLGEFAPFFVVVDVLY